ncbi:UNVERIFIED_CONTAM: hypothetical protein PYX00_002889 [Menopon gallinae]|uniref:Uncharacterized protein n=1 Tax=Menopon gallinae TaxID=328185 RepID=A0AAW2HZ08_9NEOP
MPMLELNVRKNEEIVKVKGGTAETRALDWNSEVDSSIEPFDLIVASDCVYYHEGVNGLINTIHRLATTETEIYVSQENRSYSETQSQVWKNFCTQVVEYFKVKIIPMSQQHEDYRSGDIYLMQLMKK